MKNVLRLSAMTIAVAFLFAGAAPAFSAEGDIKIAIVDVERILNDSQAAQSIKEQIRANREKAQKELAARESELKSMQEELTGLESNSSDAAIQKKAEFEKKLIDARQLVQKRRSALEKAAQDSIDKLKIEATQVIADIAKSEAYDLVITRQAVILAEDALDITDTVMKALDGKIKKIDVKVESN